MDNTQSRRDFLRQGAQALLAAGGLAAIAGSEGCKQEKKWVSVEDAVIARSNPYKQLTEVTPQNYESITKLKVPTFILFTSPSCGFSAPLIPAYEEASKNYANTDIFLARCDLSKPENHDIAMDLVDGIPPRMSFMYGHPRKMIDGRELGVNVSDKPVTERAEAMKKLIDSYVDPLRPSMSKYVVR